MKNHNDKAMENYFSSMLSETAEENPAAESVIAELQKKLDALPAVTPVQSEPLEVAEVQAITVAQGAEDVPASQSQPATSWKNIEVDNEFQALFFQLAGLTFAVPLIDLGGIHHLDSELNTLFGKPSWFSGVMPRGEALYNIVDTAQWIGTGKTAETLNYSHYILLGSTQWGLSCEKLLGTETLVAEQIEWRKERGKRPWLAGMVKDKMCALIHAQELIKLLNNGMDIHGR